MPTVTVDVDIDVWEVIDEVSDEDLIEEMSSRGYTVQKGDSFTLDREDLNYLLERISDTDLEGRRVYEKLKNLRFG
jgi:hypothetical protein